MKEINGVLASPKLHTCGMCRPTCNNFMACTDFGYKESHEDNLIIDVLDRDMHTPQWTKSWCMPQLSPVWHFPPILQVEIQNPIPSSGDLQPTTTAIAITLITSLLFSSSHNAIRYSYDAEDSLKGATLLCSYRSTLRGLH